MKQVLSIQSLVASGRVGNRAATLVLEHFGLEPVIVPTLFFVHHPGHGKTAALPIDAAAVAALLAGLDAAARLERLAAVLTGHLASPDVGEAVIQFLDGLRQRNRLPFWLCDPVMGEEGRGFYVPSGLPELLRERALPHAAVVTPNRFELAWLAGRPVDNPQDALAAARALHARGPRLVVATGLPTRAPDRLGVLWSAPEAAFWVETPRLRCPTSGAGDVFAARLLVELLAATPPALALARTVSATFAVLEETARLGTDELALVAAAEKLAGSPPRFWPERIG
ncbi:Pyridoxal kinase PdxY [bacterium HR40]|nr:Pyridoxal kinase PdxY [bacterium HR40]